MYKKQQLWHWGLPMGKLFTARNVHKNPTLFQVRISPAICRFIAYPSIIQPRILPDLD